MIPFSGVFYMSEFWYSVMSLTEKYGWYYQGFRLFGTGHLCFLAGAVAVWVLCSLLYKRFSQKGRSIMLRALALFIVLYEAATLTAYAVTDQWTNGVLPLHLCSINIFVCTFYAFFPNKLTADFLYGVCLPGALFALVVPSWNTLPLWNFFCIHSFILHIVLVMFPILLIVGGHRPRVGSLWKLFLILVVLCVPISYLNAKLNTNFFFISGTSDNALLNVLRDNLPDYRIGLLLVISAVWIIMFTPWAVAEKLKKPAKL